MPGSSRPALSAHYFFYLLEADVLDVEEAVGPVRMNNCPLPQRVLPNQKHRRAGSRAPLPPGWCTRATF